MLPIVWKIIQKLNGNFVSILSIVNILNSYQRAEREFNSCRGLYTKYIHMDGKRGEEGEERESVCVYV